MRNAITCLFAGEGSFALPACAGLLMGVLFVASATAALRDPTEPPAAAQAPAASASENGVSTLHHIVVSNGRSYVVERGRRFGVGDTLGNARIERIDSDAVWLREAQGLRRVPLYAGVIKRAEPVQASASSTAASAPSAQRIDRKRPLPKDAP